MQESATHSERLLQYMKEKKPYLDKKLSLKQLSLKLDISPNQLSQVINENLQKNFFDFVNTYRIDEMTTLMKIPSNQKFTILALAYQAGFNSKTTLYSAFKKMKGQSPRAYYKHLDLL